MDRTTTETGTESVAPANANVEGESPVVEAGETTATATVHAGGVELERTIGITGGLAIGVGTMVGAGIFVFPGLAAGRAGPAAAASFALGAVVALLVAVPCSELATAMPRSGGGYYYVSRVLGAPYGAAVGLGLWLGLVFASGFYLVGFGQYAAGVLAEVGVAVASAWPPTALALGTGVLLTAVSVGGTENSAAVQNLVVSALLAILTVFLVYGGLDAAGIFGRRTAPEVFFRFGVPPVFTTAAFVFTAYLGFAQVATVAGDMKDPGRNLPLAMIGSVLVVAVLNVATVLVATSAFGSEQLARFGETALVDVARSYIGPVGAIVILVAGLLATVSSANASILSSSRAVYALSRDALIPSWASRLNFRYGTPHIALTLAGGPVLVLVAWGEVAVLAEVASFLHLVMYGLICVTLVVVRRRDPEWYDPAFRMPGVPWLPAVGALASFGLLLLMSLRSQIIGLAVMVAAVGWYYAYARNVRLGGALG
ncbi:MAG: APC family permease [Haloplanus sp.]